MSLDTAAANDGTREQRSELGRGLAFLLVATFFSNAPVYLNLFVAPAIRPMHWMFAFGMWIWRFGFDRRFGANPLLQDCRCGHLVMHHCAIVGLVHLIWRR